ncbi:hypothetical protein [Methylobacterium radiotolerans]|uniref:hypothetical protein n=1 Tax=Methylobacterium radiotolerans TaxID=31998 RepID=UPI001191B22A|nr:hypothetical protein [Methylobacterium radiotolerans]GEN01760.1 hypothetical protein MRA01_62990 [Methylobacterium radiotolerans]
MPDRQPMPLQSGGMHGRSDPTTSIHSMRRDYLLHSLVGFVATIAGLAALAGLGWLAVQIVNYSGWFPGMKRPPESLAECLLAGAIAVVTLIITGGFVYATLDRFHTIGRKIVALWRRKKARPRD